MLKVDARSEAAMAHLSSADPVMARLVAQYGPLVLTPTTDYFFTLLESIISQQLSGKVVDTITKRVRALVPRKETPEAEDVLALPDQALRDAGLSWSKVSYIKDLAQHVVSRTLDLAHIAQMDDEEVIKELVAVKGIGRWTAEMFLIFSLARPDVFAVDDYGIRVAMMRLYNLPKLPKPAAMREIAERWRPYRSYALLYLWRNLDTASPKVQAMEARG
jgi:DNA-3-methyladenine glycosylase II